MISEKNILQSDIVFEGKNSCKEIPSDKKFFNEKISFKSFNAYP